MTRVIGVRFNWVGVMVMGRENDEGWANAWGPSGAVLN